MTSTLKKIRNKLMLTAAILLISTIAAYTWDFVLQGTLSETFDDNVNASADDQEYDFLTNLTAGIGVEHEGKTYTLYDTNEKIPLHSAFLGHTMYFTRQLYANVHAGADYSVTDAGATYGPNILLSLIDDIDENNQLNLTFAYGQSLNPYDDEVFENWNISLNFTRQVLERLHFALSAFYGQGEYRESGTRNSLLGLTTNLSYEIKENIFGSVSYNLSRNGTRLENAEETAYFRNRITISLGATI